MFIQQTQREMKHPQTHIWKKKSIYAINEKQQASYITHVLYLSCTDRQTGQCLPTTVTLKRVPVQQGKLQVYTPYTGVLVSPHT